MGKGKPGKRKRTKKKYMTFGDKEGEEQSINSSEGDSMEDDNNVIEETDSAEEVLVLSPKTKSLQSLPTGR